MGERFNFFAEFLAGPYTLLLCQQVDMVRHERVSVNSARVSCRRFAKFLLVAEESPLSVKQDCRSFPRCTTCCGFLPRNVVDVPWRLPDYTMMRRAVVWRSGRDGCACVEKARTASSAMNLTAFPCANMAATVTGHISIPGVTNVLSRR